ncbi:VOC family protein [Candidatus Micrarchaeota archaeon]|jgi:catechol 2,3-dioxygenase-like lactoylglutathione lyase family enzyme|nr:VOC family protein [Candidatus Micrarchaeota archaeon]
MEFNKLVPELIVSNLEKSLNFYEKILNFKIEYERTENKFVFLSYNGSQIMIQEMTNKTKKTWISGKCEYPFGRGINLQIETNELDRIVDSLKKNNWKIEMGPEKNVYRKDNEHIKMREILVMDPDGYLLRFSQVIN